MSRFFLVTILATFLAACGSGSPPDEAVDGDAEAATLVPPEAAAALPSALEAGGAEGPGAEPGAVEAAAVEAPAAGIAPADAARAERMTVEAAIIRRFFQAVSSADYDGLRDAVTPDFELVEDTLVLDLDGFIGLVRSYQTPGTSIAYTFHDFNTQVQGDVAWTRYRNDALMHTGDGDRHLRWLESAVLRKVDGEWKVARLQSTPIAD